MSGQQQKKPNVLLLTIDTLRADMLSCSGYSEQLTPHIDQLAESGIRFEQAITGGSWTQAAFPVIMTSTYASMYGGCLGPLSPQRPSPIEALAAAGYTTAGFSTSPLVSRTYGYQRGFEQFVDLVPQESDPKLRKIRGGERILRTSLTHFLSNLLGIQTRPARLYVSAKTLVNTVVNWLHECPEPFFGWAHFMDIHWPYHREETLESPSDISRAWQDMGHLHRVNWNGASISEMQRAHYLELYKQAVQYADTHIGQLVEILKREGFAKNTVIILLADHGEELLERGQWGHFETNLYDEILRVPLILSLPGVEGGWVEKRQVRTLDIMPTVLDLCGCNPPERMEGTSLAPLWTGQGAYEPLNASISEMWRDTRHIIAFRTETNKFIWDSRYPEEPRLFDLRSDPKELHNIAAQNSDLIMRYQAQVNDHLRKVAESSKAEIPVEPELEAEMIRRLRDLGYVE
jgi:arylsulfatase A-like enzyme